MLYYVTEKFLEIPWSIQTYKVEKTYLFLLKILWLILLIKKNMVRILFIDYYLTNE